MLLKSDGVISGLNVVGRVCQQVDPEIDWSAAGRGWLTPLRRGTVIGEVSGPARSVLTAERTALNFLQRLSGVATLTRAVRRRGRRHACPRSSTRARRRPACACSRSTRCALAAATNHRIDLVRRRAHQGQPHRRACGGDDRRRPCTRAREPAPHTVEDRGRGATASTQLDEALAARRRHHPARQHAARDDARGGRSSPAAGRFSRRRAASISTTVRAIAETGRRPDLGRRADPFGARARYQPRSQNFGRIGTLVGA